MIIPTIGQGGAFSSGSPPESGQHGSSGSQFRYTKTVPGRARAGGKGKRRATNRYSPDHTGSRRNRRPAASPPWYRDW